MNPAFQMKNGRTPAKRTAPTTHANGNAFHLEYEGALIDFSSDAWFNATKAGARYKKEPAQWLRLPSTVSYIHALRRKYVNFAHLKTRRGQGGGTWMHPKLAVRFAQWLDVDFAVWCDEQIDRILRAQNSIAQLPASTSKRSTVAERELLFVLAGKCVARYGWRFTIVYVAMSTYAGSGCFRTMDCAQVCAAAHFGQHLLDGAVTGDEWQRLAANRALSDRESAQLSLFREIA